MLKKLFLCCTLLMGFLGIVNASNTTIQRCAVTRTEDLQDGSTQQHVVVSHDQIIEWIRSKQYIAWERFYTRAIWSQLVEKFEAALRFFETQCTERSVEASLADAIQEGIQKAAALCASEVALLQAGVGKGLINLEDIQNATGQAQGRVRMIQQVYDNADTLRQSEYTRNYIAMNVRPSLTDEELNDPEFYDHMLHIIALEDLTSMVRLQFGIAVWPESEWQFDKHATIDNASDKSVSSDSQPCCQPTYDEMTKIFEANKAEGAKIWVEHMSHTTKEEFLSRMAHNGSTPSDMISEWITEPLQALQQDIKTRSQVPEKIISLINTDYIDHTDALIMKFTPDTAMNQAAATIEEVRTLIVEQFMRIYDLVEESTPAFAFKVDRPNYQDGLLKLLYGLSELTLQRWAEHDLSAVQIRNLFEAQYRSAQKFMLLVRYALWGINDDILGNS